MKKIIILKGMSGCGKTTWAKDKVQQSSCSYKRINKDDIRAMLDNKKHTKGNEKFVLEVRDTLILKSLKDGKSVIIDDTNLNPKHEERIRKIIKHYTGETGQIIQIIIKKFDKSPEECIKNDLVRKNSVGSKVIWKQYNDYIKVKEDRIQNKLTQNNDLPKAIICDIDGTVALNTGGRSPFDGTRVHEDTPNIPIIQIVEKYKGHVIFLSGREDYCKIATKYWIKDNIQLFTNNFTLLMRRTGDNRKDYIIKKEIFENEIYNKYYVDYVLDDRLQVCRMWYSLGLTLLRVGDPESDF